MRTLPKRQCDAGFTLVELLVVVGIIALLAAMLTPALMAALDHAREGRTQGLIHQCELAAQAFFQDHGDYPPSHWSELDTVFETDPWNLFVGDEDGDASGDYIWDTDPTWDAPF
ncbi:MAG: type II secretion system protein, partial [Planctomycetota bacterium]